ncbi:MAG: hypothetical protein ACLSAP_03540 [Oscillospiraceae bacterium]
MATVCQNSVVSGAHGQNRMMKDSLKLVDIVVELVDARIRLRAATPNWMNGWAASRG